MTTHTFIRRVPSLALLCAAAGLCGCTYSTWPPIEEGARQNNPSQVNNMPTPVVVGEALSFVTLRYPPVANAERGMVYQDAFAFCLPAGTDAPSYDAIARRVQRGAQPADDSNKSLFTYYITRVIVRGVTAEVDILRPVPELGVDAQGNPRYQGVTVYLTGNFSNWKVERHHTFPVGLFDVPARTTRPVVLPTWGKSN